MAALPKQAIQGQLRLIGWNRTNGTFKPYLIFAIGNRIVESYVISNSVVSIDDVGQQVRAVISVTDDGRNFLNALEVVRTVSPDVETLRVMFEGTSND